MSSRSFRKTDTHIYLKDAKGRTGEVECSVSWTGGQAASSLASGMR